MLVLKEADIKKSLPIKEALEVNKDAFIQQASESAIVPERIQIPTPKYEGVTLFKPAKVGGDLGLKVVSVRPKNASKNLPTVPGYIFLVDEETGSPLALMDATYLTALRTAAGSALATDYLAKKDAHVLTVFGAGLQATAHIEAILTVRESIKTVWIWNRTKENAVKLQNTMQSAYPNVSFKVAEDTKQCVEQADIIVTATNSQTPVFDGKLLKKGVHINAVGSYRPATQELDEHTVVNAKIVLDIPSAVEAGDLNIPIKNGSLDKNKICGQIGDLFLDKIKVRTSPDDITLFKSVGTAVQDMSTAGAVVRKAKQLGLGTVVDF